MMSRATLTTAASTPSATIIAGEASRPTINAANNAPTVKPAEPGSQVSTTAAHQDREYTGWIVTNTRCTDDALAYARCVGLRILSWRHPEGRGLERMIEEKKLYPVTMVYGIQAGLVEKMIEERILLLKDLLAMSLETVQARLGLTPKKAKALKAKAEALCT